MGDVKVLRPFMSFNTAEITDAWTREWGEEPGEEREDWEILNWQVLADGKIALIYCLYDKVASDAETHCVNHYRVLIYDMTGGMKLLERHRFRLEDAYLHQVYYREGELWTIERDRHTNNYYTLPNWPVRDTGRGYKLFYDVTDAAAKSDGTLVVGYSTQQDREERVSLIEFGEGQDRRYREDKVLICECVNLDKNEDNWGFMVPQMELVHFTADSLSRYKTEMSGFDEFSLSDDRKLLLADFSTRKSDDRLYLMRRLGRGTYGDAVECVLEDNHEGWLSLPKAMKNWMVFKKGSWLLGVDVNECSYDGKQKTEKEIGFKPSGEEGGAEDENDGRYKKNGEAPEDRAIGFRVA